MAKNGIQKENQMKISDRLKMVKLKDIKPYPNNTKKHPPKQVEKIKYLIETNGYIQPMTVDHDNVLIMGHGRLLALESILKPDDEIEVLDLSHLPDEKKKELRILENKSISNDYFKDLLTSELESIYGDLDGINPDVIIEQAYDINFDIDELSFGTGKNTFLDTPDDLNEGVSTSTDDPDREKEKFRTLEIKFEANDYNHIKKLVKFWTDNGGSVGGKIIHALEEGYVDPD